MSEDDLKKDLRGRQKKIEKLSAELFETKAKLSIAEDNYESERQKNCRLYCKYIDVVTELAEYKKKEE